MRTRAALILGVIAVMSSCSTTTFSSGAGAAIRSSAALDASMPRSELTAVKLIKWTSNVAVNFSNGSWTFRSNGVPATAFTASHYAVPSNPLAVTASGARVITTATVLTNQHYTYTLPTTPRYASKTTTNLGAIGVMLDGAVLYNPYEANKTTVATHDNFSATADGVTASFLDSCDGHPGPGGQYHYHGLPDCLVQYATSGQSTQTTPVTSFSGSTTARVVEDNAASKQPVLLGFAFDGYGIYDNIAMNGKPIAVSSLDSCNGLFSKLPGYPHGIYHYVLENVKTGRSSINCYHGVVSSAYTHALRDSIDSIIGNGPPAGGPPPQGLSAHRNRIATTAQSLAANQNELVFLTAELEDLSRGNLC